MMGSVRSPISEAPDVFQYDGARRERPAGRSRRRILMACARFAAFPLPRRRWARSAGGRPSRRSRGRACARSMPSAPMPCSPSCGAISIPIVPGISEDCLFLNVWTPAAGATERLPVLFWIHGGAFIAGHGAEPRYDGARLASRGIIVVTSNHRLGAFGFLAHPELTAESAHAASGNYGLLDQIAALAWVKRNIAAFGGDPGSVTIAGESAGSMSVSALMASPLAAGLFQRAIGQSGALFSPSPTVPDRSLATAERTGMQIAESVGASSVAELRALSAETILAATPTDHMLWPIVDGHVLPQSPAEIFAEGRQNDVTLLAGWNRDEGFNFDVTAGTPRDIRRNRAPAFRSARRGDTPPLSARRSAVGARFRRRPHHHPADMGLDRGAGEDGNQADLSLPLRRHTGRARRLVRRAVKCGGGRLPRRRARLCLRHARRLSLDLQRRRPPDIRGDFGLLGEFREERRSQRSRPAGLARLQHTRGGSHDHRRRAASGAAETRSTPRQVAALNEAEPRRKDQPPRHVAWGPVMLMPLRVNRPSNAPTVDA